MKKYTDVDIIAELQKLVDSHVDSYGEFQNVFLSGEECTRLEAAYPGKAAAKTQPEKKSPVKSKTHDMEL